MARPEQYASWNPALRSDDVAPAMVSDSGDMSITDSKASTTETPLDPSQTVESFSHTDLPDPDVAADATEPVPVAPPVMNSHAQSNSEVEPSSDRTLHTAQDIVQEPSPTDNKSSEPVEVPKQVSFAPTSDEPVTVTHDNQNTSFPSTENAQDLSWADDNDTHDPWQLDSSPLELDDEHEESPASIDAQQPIETPKETVPALADQEQNVPRHEARDATFPPPENAQDVSWADDSTTQGVGEQDTSPWAMDTQQNKGTSITTNGEFGGTSHDFWGSPTSATGEHDFFNQLKTQTKPIYVPEADSRYEEGVPLLDESVASPTEPPANQESRIDQIFEGDEDEGEAFFNEVQQPAPAEEPRPSLHMTRKSTSQVLESLDATSPTRDSPTAQEFNSILEQAASGNQLNKSSSDEDLAARWQAELAMEQDEEPSEEDLAARWQAELDDDDDMLLADTGEDLSLEQEGVTQDNGVPAEAAPVLSSPFGTPENPARPKPQSTAYTPHQPSTSDLLQGIPTQGFAQTGMTPATDYFAPPPPRPAVSKAESFAEQSKQGYKSPYDLPDDLARPRRPAATSRPVVIPGNNAPPPPSAGVPVPPPKTSSMPTPPMGTSPSAPIPAPKNFYEELPPPPPKPQSRPSSSGRYTPGPPATTTLPVHPAMPPPANPYAGVPPPPADLNPSPSLQQPEKTDPYAGLLAPSAPSAPNVPNVASRYSPKPPSLQGGTKPPPSPRYSPAPPPTASAAPPRNRYVSQPSGMPAQATTLPFQPRTSSPLAYHEKVSYQPQDGLRRQSHAGQEQQITPQIEVQHQPMEQAAGPPIITDATAVNMPTSGDASMPPVQTSPPRNPYAPPAYVDEFSKRVAPMSPPKAPSASAPPATETQFMPPRRSQTQSPSQQMLGPRLSVPSIDPLQRPASVHGSGSPTKTASPYAPTQASVQNRAPSQQLEFIPPMDGQELDPLGRWRGAPIVKFGFGGTIISCFPQHIPRYTAGQVAPKIKSAPGEVKLHQLRDWVPTAESIVQHPGPLKNKSKKKDLLAWLSSKIAQFENEGISEAANLHPDSHKRHDEKILLWKIVRILVEHDGSLEGSEDVKKTLRGVIFPHLQQNPESDQLYGGGAPGFGAFKPMDAPSRSDAVDSQAVETLRNSLLMGDREKAVWGAVDNRMWGHAMVIASTMDKSIWKQVVQEFVRREVRSATGNTESLAALYEIFAGNIEESIDELVPPSARAGLQMISKVDGHGPSRSALEGLESWKDTLGLVLSNRTAEDHQALVALGRLLSSYGRVEAAHICFIVSRAAVFGGADDPQACIVLLGADQHLPAAALQDEDAILLTEAYEYATTVLAGAPTATMPHLLAFKLLHAWALADRGRKPEAQQYCDAIAASLKASTKPSGYYNQHLFFGVDELSARLRQTASEGGSSWISKPSMEKVSGSMWAKFNSFVAGDDSDAASTGSGKAGEGDVGPFARFTGTPTVSRSPSVTDLYGPYAASAAQPIPSSGPSRYQPTNQYAPNASPEQPRGRSSMDSQRSASFGYPYGQRRGSQEPTTPLDSTFYQGGGPYGSPSAVGYQSTPPQTSYMPLAPVEEDSATQSYPAPLSMPSQESPMNMSPYMPPGGESFGQPFDQGALTGSPSVGSGYMPPGSSTGYEPPSIETTAAPDMDMDAEPTGEETLKKKKSFMDDDDDDDMAARAAAMQKAEKERKDRETEENFRKIAEAEAKKDANQPKKSWWPGWFGGKKEENNSGGGPIRAKLGEENSFYYDKELKKWVNKKDPGSATVARGTPPPPRGPAPPSRTASGSSMPPPPASASPMPIGADSRPASSAGPPSLSSSPAPSSLGVPPPFLNATPRSVSTGAAMPTPPGSTAGAPPRPATSLSTASSIDDLLGAPQARRGGGGAKGKKKGRYVDVMAK